MKHSIHIKDITELANAAKQFLSEIGDKKIIAFYASMGAGKTTFTSALCKELGVSEDAISSPTFAIVNEYKYDKTKYIYHFDFYRINKISEALDIGFYDYIDSEQLCIIEWPENIEEILPEECLKVNIIVKEDLSRSIEWED